MPTFDIVAALESLPEDKKLAFERVQTVHAAQRLIGMEPRNDSQLTFKYAIGENY